MDFEVYVKPERQKRTKRSDRCVLETDNDKITIARTDGIKEIYYKDIDNIGRRRRYGIIVNLRNGEGFTIIPTVPHKHYDMSLGSAIGDLRRQQSSFKRMDILYNILLSKIQKGASKQKKKKEKPWEKELRRRGYDPEFFDNNK